MSQNPSPQWLESNTQAKLFSFVCLRVPEIQGGQGVPHNFQFGRRMTVFPGETVVPSGACWGSATTEPQVKGHYFEHLWFGSSHKRAHPASASSFLNLESPAQNTYHILENNPPNLQSATSHLLPHPNLQYGMSLPFKVPWRMEGMTEN